MIEERLNTGGNSSDFDAVFAARVVSENVPVSGFAVWLRKFFKFRDKRSLNLNLPVSE